MDIFSGHPPKKIVALSGGKDSTALALYMKEKYPNEDIIFLRNNTNDELPYFYQYIDKLEKILGKIIVTKGPTLKASIYKNMALPNNRMRFCTREVKIEPTIQHIISHHIKPELYIGLRADEPDRNGLYTDKVIAKYPFKEDKIDISGVYSILDSYGIKVPDRTDCARCPFQRVYDWYMLWKEYPEIYQDAVMDEIHISRFRKRDLSYRQGTKKWAANLSDLRIQFEHGEIPKPNQISSQCRLCRM